MDRKGGLWTSVVVALVANAVALAVAAIAFDKFDVSWGSFPVVVAAVSLLGLVVGPVVRSVVKEYAPAFTAAVALVTVFVVLLVADLVFDGLDIEGAGTWIMSTVVVWVAGMITALVMSQRGAGKKE